MTYRNATLNDGTRIVVEVDDADQIINWEPAEGVTVTLDTATEVVDGQTIEVT